MGLLDNIKQKLQDAGSSIKTGVQNTVGNIKSGTEHVIGTIQQKAQNVLDKGKEAAIMTLFKPFIPVAKKFLERRGIKPSDDLAELIVQVYNQRGKKTFGVTGYGPDSFDIAFDDVTETSQFGMVVTPEMVMVAIQLLQTIFSAIKEKKAKGEALTPDEQKIQDLAPEIEKALNDAKIEANQITKDSETQAQSILSGGKGKKAVLAVVALLLLFVLFMFVRRKIA